MSLQKFMEAMEFKRPFDCINGELIGRLPKSRMPIVTLQENHKSHYFDSLLVRIVHKERGEIGRTVFPFEAYLPTAMEHRRDERPDFEGPLHAWFHFGTVSWYIGIPKTTRPLCAAVEAWIKEWE